MVSRFTHVPLTGRERIGVVVSVVGLALLGLSLFGEHGEGSGAGYRLGRRLARRLRGRRRRSASSSSPA